MRLAQPGLTKDQQTLPPCQPVAKMKYLSNNNFFEEFCAASSEIGRQRQIQQLN